MIFPSILGHSTVPKLLSLGIGMSVHVCPLPAMDTRGTETNRTAVPSSSKQLRQHEVIQETFQETQVTRRGTWTKGASHSWLLLVPL